MQGKFDANRLLCHNKFARREEIKKCAFEQKITWTKKMLLNEYIVMLVKFMLHSELRKERG